MPLYFRGEDRGFAYKFLDVVFAKVAVAGGEGFIDCGLGHEFGDGNEADGAVGGGGVDGGEDGREVGRDAALRES